jgi:NitT/TauT family transport system substrate-binding protein
MALAVAEGVPVKAVAGYLQKMPDGILSLAETGIKTPKDLEGKTFAFQPGGSGEVLFPAFAQANGIDESKVKKLTVDSAAKLPTVLTGKADFTVLWGFNDLPVARKQGKNAVFMGFADNGVNVAGHGLFASADTVKNRPEVAKAFVAASVRAIDEAIKNPDVAVDALTQGRPELDKGLLLEQFKGLPDNLRTENSKGKPTSWIAPEDIKQTGELLLKYMDMKKQVPAEDLYTNQFIPLA